MNEPVRRLESMAVVLMKENIDTDQICPARFLTTTNRDGFREALFADWRRDGSGRVRAEFPLNDPANAGRSILIAGRNFGCGSSREHAVWALRDAGFRAIVAPSFADIFRRNALKNGVVPVAVDPAIVDALAGGSAPVVVDVATGVVSAAGVRSGFVLESFARLCLLEGLDELSFLLAQNDGIAEFEERRALA